jgi:hypothetical protein
MSKPLLNRDTPRQADTIPLNILKQVDDPEIIGHIQDHHPEDGSIFDDHSD